MQSLLIYLTAGAIVAASTNDVTKNAALEIEKAVPKAKSSGIFTVYSLTTALTVIFWPAVALAVVIGMVYNPK